MVSSEVEFEEHNQQVKRVWDAFNRRKPFRVPVQFAMDTKMILLNPELNRWGYTYQQYFENPDVMLEVQLEFQHWRRFKVRADWEMGLPNRWDVAIDFSNTYESTWFGCPIWFDEGQVPDVKPIIEKTGDLGSLQIPDPLHANLVDRFYRFYQYFEGKKKEGFEFIGSPLGEIGAPCGGSGTDGPFSIAANLRGTTQLCIDIYEDPGFVDDLLDFVTEGIMARIKAWLDFRGMEYPQDKWAFADDSIQLLSPETYRRFVLPRHKRLIKTFSQGGPNWIHLCGNVMQHIKTLQNELNIQEFETGFPWDLGEARRILGEEVLLIGNLAPHILLRGSEKKIIEETKQIMGSGVKEGGRFILQDGHNLAPCTPIDNLQTMYAAGKKYGGYPE